jgi:inorganic pyrophosphatase
MGAKNGIMRMGAFNSGKLLNVVIETPKGSRVKYAYQPKTGLFELKRALPEGMMFPFNFGFIPSTKAEDGDPLDILILNEEPLATGCVLKARLACAMKAEQSEDGKTVRNDRLLGFAVMKETPTFLEAMELQEKTLKEIEYFFVSYNKLYGKKFKILGKAGPKKALQLVKDAAETYFRSQEN